MADKREQQKQEEYIKLISPMAGKTRIVALLDRKNKHKYHFSHNKRTVTAQIVKALLKRDLIVSTTASDKTNEYSVAEYVLSEHGRSFFKELEPKKQEKPLDIPTQYVTLRELCRRHNINMDTPSGTALIKFRAIRVDGYAVTDPKMLDMKIYKRSLVTINNRNLEYDHERRPGSNGSG